ncbi:MAG TPA: hypothetical protein VGJ18_03360 [Gemmatimonadaceae bacterium]|jgi:hypothetical protein
MPIEYSIDSARQLVNISYLGPVTKQEIIDHRRDLEDDPRQVLRYDTIVDMRYGSVDLSPEDLRELAIAARERGWPPSRCAFVAPYESTFGELRMFEHWADRGARKYRTFRTFRDACAWLGLDSCDVCDEER